MKQRNGTKMNKYEVKQMNAVLEQLSKIGIVPVIKIDDVDENSKKFFHKNACFFCLSCVE